MTKPIHRGIKANKSIDDVIATDLNISNYYQKWNNYKIGEIKFINVRKNHPHRKIFVDYVIKHCKTVLEIGPGEMIEYQMISKQKSIKYSIIDVSDVFLKNCREKYPDVKTTKCPIELLKTHNKFDVVYACDVLEHTFNIKIAIKNIMLSANNFHMVMFKWSYVKSSMMPNWRISNNAKYWTTCYNIWKILKEFGRYGKIEYVKVCLEKTGEFIDLDDFAKFSMNRGELTHRGGDRLIIHGKSYHK